MKPSLIKARAQGRSADGPEARARPGRTVEPAARRAAETKKDAGGGPTPWIVVGAALAVGIVLAKWIDWRGHAHPRETDGRRLPASAPREGGRGAHELIVRLELELAALELKRKVVALGVGIGLAIGAASCSSSSSASCSRRSPPALATALPTWLALLIVTGILLLEVAFLGVLASQTDQARVAAAPGAGDHGGEADDGGAEERWPG